MHPDWCTGIELSSTGSNFQVTNGHGDLTFTIDADKKLTITGWAAPANELYLAGSMTNWGEGKEAMTLDEQTGKFAITKEMAAGAEFKFIDQDGTWIGGDADGNFIVQREQVVNGTELSLLLNAGNNFQIPVAGTWTLTVDKATMKLVVSGNWPAPKYAITVAECQNGTVTADQAEAEEGEEVTLTVNPDEGYALGTLTVMNGDTPVETTLNQETGKYTFGMPAAPVAVNATFQPLPVVLDGVAFATNVYASWYGNTDLALPEGITAYVVTAIDGDKAQIEPVDYIPAGVGVLLYSTTPAETVSARRYTGETATVTSMLQGGLEEMALTDGYVLYGNEFVRTLNGTLAAHRCYLPVAQSNGAPMRLRIVRASDIVTAINDVRVDGDGQVRYIDVNGRASDRPFSGINIVIGADGTVTKMVK